MSQLSGRITAEVMHYHQHGDHYVLKLTDTGNENKSIILETFNDDPGYIKCSIPDQQQTKAENRTVDSVSQVTVTKLLSEHMTYIRNLAESNLYLSLPNGPPNELPTSPSLGNK